MSTKAEPVGPGRMAKKAANDGPAHPSSPPSGDTSPLDDFSVLRFVEKPDSPMNSDTLPQTLSDCVGYLKGFPLTQPNADAKDPTTISTMANILTLPEAQRELEGAMGFTDDSQFTLSPQEYRNRQEQVFDYQSEPLNSLLRQAKRESVHKRAPGTLGKAIAPGTMAFYKKFGIIRAVPEGRWWLFPDMLAKWTRSDVSLDQDIIRIGNDELLIIRVNEGEVGLITDQGVHKLLDIGTHVFNSGMVKFTGVVEYSSNSHFGHGPYHYINVPRGQYAKVWAEVVALDGVKSLVPRLLKEGEHFIKSTFFRYEGLVDVSAEYIGHGSVHILNVLKGKVAKIYHDNIPRLLCEGEHIIETPNFEYCGTVNIVESLCIVHGTITILQVPQGKIALVWNKNEPEFIDRPGIYEFNRDDFQFCEFKDCSDRLIQLGSRKEIQVYTGSVGISYDKGELKILTNGRHVINSSTHVFERFLSTKQRSIRLVTLGNSAKITRSSMQKSKKKGSSVATDFPNAEDADLLVCETKDLVKVGVRADVFYSITDPEKCIRNLDTDELEDLVRETAVATLTNIIRSTALNQIAQNKNVSASAGPEAVLTAVAEEEAAEEDDDEVPQAVSLFFDRAHDEFMAKLHEDFISRYGVDIANIRMEAFKIMDTELADQISKHVLTTAQVENELANLEGQSMIATQKERTQAEVQTINAQAEAKSLKTRTDAENQRKIDAAEAEAQAMKIKQMAIAQAEADVILTKAKAEAQAIAMKAQAEAERAQKLSETMLGQQESLLSIYSDMVKESNTGVSKVIYMDPSVNRDSPFALGSLDGLNRDLHALSKMGIAAKENGGTNGKRK